MSCPGSESLGDFSGVIFVQPETALSPTVACNLGRRRPRIA